MANKQTKAPLVLRRASLADAHGIASLLVESFRLNPSTRWRCAFDLKTAEECRNYLVSWVPLWIRTLVGAVQRADSVVEERTKALMQQRTRAAQDWFPANNTPSDYLYLKFLATLPEHQGKGVASALLAEGCEISEQAKVPIYLVASDHGKRLYTRRGFATLHEMMAGEKDSIQWEEMFMKYSPEATL